MSLVLLNFGLDELGNPRLRTAGSVARRPARVAAVAIRRPVLSRRAGGERECRRSNLAT